MADDDIEVGEDVDVTVITNDDGDPVAAIVDDVVVASAPGGSLVDETIDVLDGEGDLVLEDETVSVYDADGQLIGRDETVVVALDE